jgi:hypothetical protein
MDRDRIERVVLRVALIVALCGAGCDRSAAKVASRVPGAPAEVPDGTVGPHKGARSGRPLFVDAPELAGVLEIGIPTQVDESWVELPGKGKVNHCFAVYFELHDVHETGAWFDDQVRALGHEPSVTADAITVDKEGLVVALMLTGAGRGVVNGCWTRDTDPADAFDDLIPAELPLSAGRELAAQAGRLAHVTLEWSEDRGVSLRIAGSIEAGEADKVAARFRAAGYGDVQPGADVVEHEREAGVTSFTTVSDDRWIVELNHADGESPFQR